MKVAELMNRRVVWVPPFMSVDDATRVASTKGIRHLVVLERGDLVGVLCVCDLKKGGGSVADCMSAPVTVEAYDPVERAAEVMRTRGVGCLPVTVAGLLVGIVSRRDLDRVGCIERSRCASCGYTHNLGTDPHAPEVTFCLYCRERTPPPDDVIDIGGGD